MPVEIQALAARVRYGGNPEHKRDPGDFGLTPPAQPRADKSLCDGTGLNTKSAAEALLKEAVRKSMISERVRGGFPQNIWAVTPSGVPVEAQLENDVQGHYHGYPMPETDPFRDEVRAQWNRQP